MKPTTLSLQDRFNYARQAQHSHTQLSAAGGVKLVCSDKAILVIPFSQTQDAYLMDEHLSI